MMTGRRRRVPIRSTRSSVSSLSAIGLAVMVRSACGDCSLIRVASSALIAATPSSGSVRGTETMSSPTIRAPKVEAGLPVPATPRVWATRSLDHRAPAHPGAIGDRRVDVGVVQRPLQALNMAGPLAHQLLAGAQQAALFLRRGIGDETTANQAMRQQIGQPS
jgi:hypothetical protein